MIALGVIVVPCAPAAACPTGDKQIAAMAAAPGSIVVDGDLREWTTACWITDFEQQAPTYGARPTHPIKLAITIADDTLYVAARMWSDGPADIDDALTQRDDLGQAERIIVSVDPSLTQRTAYSFAVSAAGVRADWIHTDDTQGARDATWNPVWHAHTRMLADGWSEELAMPLSQLRLPRTALPAWGINFNWYIPHRHEDVFWRAVAPDRTAWASIFGALVDLPAIVDRTSLELLPYVASRLVVDEIVPAPPSQRVLAGFEAGLDVKLRPRSGLVLAGSLNPDFGQVDVDPAFVNLSAFEVLLPEKRPFFVENNALFANSPANVFYSRRIGALPRSLPAVDALEVPSQVRILGALAASGYLARRTQIAALAAVTDATSAAAIVDGRRARVAIAPLSVWSAVRVEQQLGPSVIGATATAVRRDLADPELAARLPERALVGGVDALVRSASGTFELTTFLAGSLVSGAATAIAALARGSAHYFQRPDAEHLEFDPTARRLAGWTAGVFGTKRAGPWRGALGAYAESPGYEINDLGTLRSADDLATSASWSFQDTTPTRHVYAWSVGGGVAQEWNFGGMRKPAAISADGAVTYANFASTRVGATLSTPGDSDDLTRGGPRMRVGWAAALQASASSPRDRNTQLTGTVRVEVSPTLAQGVTASATLVTRVTPALRFDVSPSLTVARDRRQFVTAIAAADSGGGGEDTFGTRYLFGDLRRAEAALELRTTWSLSPDLVITLYAQPFAAVGRYRSLGELTAAGAADLRTYDGNTTGDGVRTIVDGAASFTIGEPDYTVVSLRSTAVLKWELAPGSTLFVVWQQERGAGAQLSHPLSATLPDIFTATAIHTLAIKLSYWFG
ncbi:MAG: DUF5916 domain-containing protein [Proteobacteria bacterium]|nr:DUF5916 domain-containing protein [Pseudomonadota bacterium]